MELTRDIFQLKNILVQFMDDGVGQLHIHIMISQFFKNHRDELQRLDFCFR